ncbi:hypothetical protein EDB81DRAFT_829564 [Dactylonectria macrodidyma]|uniref:Uncharacterized protein n=1 Tax=Dactylonectria macrodidyma TaxID=307937 RepID=A0A9P9I8B6_9HYPO|nr:hypothetical protein EDB81DRAFT_829564 [Dactylonectria macrodidyma]
MQVITTTTSFRHAARQINLKLQDFALVQHQTRIWRLQTEGRGIPEEIKSLVRSYNEDDDKYPQIEQTLKSERLTIQFDRGLDIIWLEGSIYVKDGQIAIAIILPKPQNLQDEAETTRSPDSSDGMRPTEDDRQQINLSLAVGGEPTDAARISAKSLAQKPDIQIRRLAGQTHTSISLLQPGDIVVLNAHERIEVKSGGVALILIRYKVWPTVETGLG